MGKKVEFHDSNIEAVIQEEGFLKIVFDSFVVLNMTDKFGFDFDNTSYSEGFIRIKNPKFSTQLTDGEVYSGHLRVGDYRYNLIPVGLDISQECVLVLVQESGEHRIYGEQFHLVLTP